MEKPNHEPGEPSLEELAQRFSVQLSRLQNVQAMFLVRHQSENLLSEEQQRDMFQCFESEQIEIILADIQGRMPMPWRAHPRVQDEFYSDTDASADTFIDPKKKSIVRWESMQAEGMEQTEIIMTYRLNEHGRLQQLINTQTEELPDELQDLIHPALRTIEMPDGEKLNDPASGEDEIIIEMAQKQASEFVAMIEELISRLIRVYNQPGWQLMLDTERTPDGVGSGDPRAVYKIERIV